MILLMHYLIHFASILLIIYSHQGYQPIVFFSYGVIVVVQLLSHVQLFFIPKDCGPQSSSSHGISQARILEWALPPGYPLNPGIEPTSPPFPALQVDSIPL